VAGELKSTPAIASASLHMGVWEALPLVMGWNPWSWRDFETGNLISTFPGQSASQNEENEWPIQINCF